MRDPDASGHADDEPNQDGSQKRARGFEAPRRAAAPLRACFAGTIVEHSQTERQSEDGVQLHGAFFR
jgi:hypothetical protein